MLHKPFNTYYNLYSHIEQGYSYIYEIEVSEQLPQKHFSGNDIQWLIGDGKSRTYKIAINAPDAISAVFTIMDRGYTPVKLINPKTHD